MNEVIARQETMTAAAQPANMIQLAIDRGASVDQLEKLWELQTKYEANEARKAFVSAMNRFRANPPKIVKDKHVSFNKTEYKHATLNNVCDKIGASLTAVGISFRWETNQDNGLITVSCVLTHDAGHMEKTTLSASPDASGGKNSIQAVGSTVTYLQRYTLLSATGMATEEQDTDGVAPPENISEGQLEALMALVAEVGANAQAFAKFLKVERLDELPTSGYDNAVKWLEAKRKKGAAQ